MNKLNLILLFWGLSLMVNYGVYACGVSFPEEVEVNAAIKKIKKGEFSLRIELKSKEEVPLKFYRDALSRHNVTIVAVVDNASDEPLKEKFILDNATPGVVEILPGKTMYEDYSLSSNFPGLSSVLKKNNVVLFWGVNLKPIGDYAEKRFGGYVVIEKNKSGVLQL